MYPNLDYLSRTKSAFGQSPKVLMSQVLCNFSSFSRSTRSNRPFAVVLALVYCEGNK